jgi:hypothetical protein
MKNTKKIITILAAGIMIISSFVSIPALNINSEDKETIVLNLSFEKPEINEEQIEDQIFSIIRISGLSNSEGAGKPSLPKKTVNILLPPQSYIDSIEVKKDNVGTIYNVDNIRLGPVTYYPLSFNEIAMSIVDEEQSKVVFHKRDLNLDIINRSAPRYDTSKIYPKSSFSDFDIQYKRGMPILSVDLYPIQYDSNSKSLTYYTDMELKITAKIDSSIGVNDLYRGLPRDLELVEEIVDNPSMINRWPEPSLSALSDMPTGNMLIITTDGLKNTGHLDRLAEAHKTQGINEVYIVTINEMYGVEEYNNIDYQTLMSLKAVLGGERFFKREIAMMRECIRHHYLHKGVDFVLLAGDDNYEFEDNYIWGFYRAPIVRFKDIEDYGVPTCQLFMYTALDKDNDLYLTESDLSSDDATEADQRDSDESDDGSSRDKDGDGCADDPVDVVNSPENDIFTASDIPFACLDNLGRGTSSSSYFMDFRSEVYVGRAPVSNSYELSRFVSKTIKYMQADETSYNKVLMVGEHLGFGGVAEFGANSMNALLGKPIKTSYGNGIPVKEDNTLSMGGYYIEKLYEKDEKWSGNDLISIVNRGNVNMINHLGHANIEYNMKLRTSSYDTGVPVSGFSNSEYPIFYSQGCFAGAFDAGGRLYQDESIAESLIVKTGKAGVAGIWNSHFGWGLTNSIDGPSQLYHRSFINAIYGGGRSLIGVANQESKEFGGLGGFGSISLFLYYCINLIGDPALYIHGAPDYPFPNPENPPEDNEDPEGPPNDPEDSDTPVEKLPFIELTKPASNKIYLKNKETSRASIVNLIIGPITIKANSENNTGVKFFLDDELKFNDTEYPYEYNFNEKLFGLHTIKTVAYNNEGYSTDTSIDVIIINFGFGK